MSWQLAFYEIEKELKKAALIYNSTLNEHDWIKEKVKVMFKR